MSKRARVEGLDKLFAPPEAVAPPAPPGPQTGPPQPAPAIPAPSAGRWDATHHRRTFHCPDALWDRLGAWCARTGTSRSAAISRALEAFLAAQEGHPETPGLPYHQGKQ